MSDTRDTLILPCRHLCLCNSCADSLRYQANNCPICRAPFRALLQIRAVQKSSSGHTNLSSPQQTLQDTNGENIPPGYVAVSLIEALNGPSQLTSSSMKSQLDIVSALETNETDSVKAAAGALNRSTDPSEKTKDKKDKASEVKDSSFRRAAADSLASFQIRLSVLLPKDDINSVSKSTARERSPRPKGSAKQSSHDSMHMVNEKNAANLQAADAEEDSDHENLSPLLQSKKKSQAKPTGNQSSAATTQQPIALHINGVNESIDDTDDDPDVCKPNGLLR